MENTRLEPAQTQAVGQRVRGEDIAGGLLRLFRDVRQQAAVVGLRAVRLAALGAVPLETVDHLVEANLLRSAGQLVPPVGPARRGDEAGPAEDHQQCGLHWPQYYEAHATSYCDYALGPGRR